MNVELMKGIASVSGTVSRYRDGRKLVARTYKRTGKTCFYVVDPRRRRTRSVFPTNGKSGLRLEGNPRVLAARSNFGTIASEVARRLKAGDTRPRSVIWKEVATTLSAE